MTARASAAQGHANEREETAMRSRTLLAAAVLMLPCLDAPAITPLEQCNQSAAETRQTRDCLERMTKEASDALAEAFFAARDEMNRFDRATGRGTASKALEASERAFRDFRDRNCAWVAAVLSPGTGSSNVKLDCEIRMDRARADELRTPLARKVSQRKSEAGAAPGLTGIEWHLSQVMFDGAATSLQFNSDSPVNIRFDASGNATGRGPINRFSGRYSATADGRLSWSGAGLQSTMMAGPPEAMEQEDLFFQILGQVSRYRISGSQLILETEDSNSSLTFER
jgi:heat shock protein HslJ